MAPPCRPFLIRFLIKSQESRSSVWTGRTVFEVLAPFCVPAVISPPGWTPPRFKKCRGTGATGTFGCVPTKSENDSLHPTHATLMSESAASQLCCHLGCGCSPKWPIPSTVKTRAMGEGMGGEGRRVFFHEHPRPFVARSLWPVPRQASRGPFWPVPLAAFPSIFPRRVGARWLTGSIFFATQAEDAREHQTFVTRHLQVASDEKMVPPHPLLERCSIAAQRWTAQPRECPYLHSNRRGMDGFAFGLI